MQIHTNFTGGNIIIEKIEGNHVYVKPDLSDTTSNWFYWAFCVEHAEGETLTFHFEENKLGYFGPAISHDLESWDWLGQLDDENTFSYTFEKGENKVYFAHDMLYHPKRFHAFCDKHHVDVPEFCKSKKGASVPYITFGKGEKTVFLTARHHACEATGNYVLEGVLENLIPNPIEGLKFICVPFVDYDGVVSGDQGKNRIPHDHNRDYIPTEAPIHPETAKIREMLAQEDILFAFDFHSPYHKGDEHDTALIVQKVPEMIPRYQKFGAILESCVTPDAFQYYTKNDLAPGEKWNKAGTHAFATYAFSCKDTNLAFTLETPYFGTAENRFTQEGGIALGKAFANAIRAYYEEL